MGGGRKRNWETRENSIPFQIKLGQYLYTSLKIFAAVPLFLNFVFPKEKYRLTLVPTAA